MTQQQPQHRQHQPEDEGSTSSSSSSSSSMVAAHPPPTSSFMMTTTRTSWLTPGSALLLSSLPLGLGAYIGYRRTLHESSTSAAASTLSSVSSSSSSSLTTKHSNSISITRGVAPPVLAARALIIGTLLSISGTALLLSSIFLLSGCKSVDELIHSCKIWGPKQLQGLETILETYAGVQFGTTSGTIARRLAKLQYEQETLGMTEEEELDYIGNKYKGELFNETTTTTNTGETRGKKPWWSK